MEEIHLADRITKATLFNTVLRIALDVYIYIYIYITKHISVFMLNSRAGNLQITSVIRLLFVICAGSKKTNFVSN